jgi:glycosyltransferase involved in cell wall biosynthesis
LKLGIDYRSALINREGIGRTTRELTRALIELGHGPELGLFGWTLAPVRFARAELGLELPSGDGEARLARFRFPSRWIPDLCRTLGKGVDDLSGGCDVFHHTQPHILPVRKAVEVGTVFDCIYAKGTDFVSAEAAESMTQAARAMIAKCAQLIVPSRFVAGEVVELFGADPARVHVAWLGCDHVLRRNGGAVEHAEIARERCALTVSRVDRRKNHVRMLRAFERLVAEGLLERWIVAGPDGHGVEDFDAALASSPVRSRVERLKHVEDVELPRLYRTASVFLFASLDEGFGLPPLEALACGTPVVAGRNSSMPEVLGDAALLVEATDEDAIHGAAKLLLTDRELAQELQQRGLSRAQALSWKSCARAVWDVYAKAASAPPLP